MNKSVLMVISFTLVIVIGIIFFGGMSIGNYNINENVENSEVIDGIQYVSIRAKGGYWPRFSSAQAGVPTKLIVKSEGTFDCSASLVINSLGFQKILEPNSEEIIDVGIPVEGEELIGVCSMGMYSFKVLFE